MLRKIQQHGPVGDKSCLSRHFNAFLILSFAHYRRTVCGMAAGWCTVSVLRDRCRQDFCDLRCTDGADNGGQDRVRRELRQGAGDTDSCITSNLEYLEDAISLRLLNVLFPDFSFVFSTGCGLVRLQDRDLRRLILFSQGRRLNVLYFTTVTFVGQVH